MYKAQRTTTEGDEANREPPKARCANVLREALRCFEALRGQDAVAQGEKPAVFMGSLSSGTSLSDQ